MFQLANLGDVRMNVFNFFPRVSSHRINGASLFSELLIVISTVSVFVHGAPERKEDSDRGPAKDFLCLEIVT